MVMAERYAAGKQSFQGFSLISLIKKRGLARAVDPISITM